MQFTTAPGLACRRSTSPPACVSLRTTVRLGLLALTLLAPTSLLAAQPPADVAAVDETGPDADPLDLPGPMQQFEDRLNDVAGKANGLLGSVLFYDLSSPFVGDGKGLGFAAVVVYLVCAATFFTLLTGFLNLRAFKHAILITMGRYDDATDPGEVSHFQALAAALSATVGLGNIAGVAIAISLGGPGATFWMIVAGFLGMSSKFMECTLGQKYREVRPDGRIMGGAMFYLSKGLKELGLGPLGKGLAILFAVLCIGGSFGGGNAFQVSQSLNAVNEQLPFLKTYPWVYGLTMAFLVGLVILGGIRRIAQVAEKIVPVMCGIYVSVCLFILLKNLPAIPAAFHAIIDGAFTPEAGYGGLIGVLVVGFKRAAFSNEAGVGSAAIAHSAAKTDFPVREGIVALLEPFIDTVVVCTMTALVIVITGVYADQDPVIQHLIATNQGAALTAAGMAREVSWFPYLLSLATVLFAYSTMISWSYYGERCWAWLFGDRTSLVYRILFLICVFLGSIVSASNVLEFSDLMILAMCVPNIIGLVLLAPGVRRDLTDYWRMYKSGTFTNPSASATERPTV